MFVHYPTPTFVSSHSIHIFLYTALDLKIKVLSLLQLRRVPVSSTSIAVFWVIHVTFRLEL